MRVRELVPTAKIPAEQRRASVLPSDLRNLDGLPIRLASGSSVPLGLFLEQTCTDAFIVLKEGRVVYERYFEGCEADTLHLVHSVSKSYCAALAGLLVGRGLFSVDDAVTDLAPDLRGTSFEGATVRNLLDMRTGTYCPEDYDLSARDAPMTMYATQAGYTPLDGTDSVGILAHMGTLTNDRFHGGAFEYRSVLTNVLGRVLESVTGTPYPLLLAQALWRHLGPESEASIMLDPYGFPAIEGGMSCTLRDAARFGEAYRNNGIVGGTQVIPSSWVHDTFQGDGDLLEAFEATGRRAEAPSVMYHNGWWGIEPGRSIAALGIYGQLIYVDRASGLTMARLASEPSADDDRTWATLVRASDDVLAACTD